VIDCGVSTATSNNHKKWLPMMKTSWVQATRTNIAIPTRHDSDGIDTTVAMVR
jgi:hypothetical protein